MSHVGTRRAMGDGMTNTNREMLGALSPLAAAGDWRAIIQATSGSNESDVTYIWSLAMTAQWGPTGIHPSRCDEQGRPDLAKCLDCPRVAQEMTRARETLVARLAEVAS